MKLLYITITETFFRQIKPVVIALGDSVKEVHIRVESLDCKERDELWTGPVYIRNYAAPILKKLCTVRNISSYFHWISQKNQDWDFLIRYLMHHSVLVSFISRLLHRIRVTRLLPAKILARFAKDYDINHDAPIAIFEDVRNLSPDIAIICPLLYPNSMEADYAKVCRALDIPVVVMIASWDNLTSKNTFPIKPDHIFVWNVMQAEQLIRYHEIPEAIISVTGAQLFDYMFEDIDLIDRREFCSDIGLDTNKRILLWTASSRVAGMDEPGLVKKLLKKMREQKELCDLQILIRPHPKYQEQWAGWCEPGTYVWSDSRFPHDTEACQGIRTSLHHAFAVVGLSTSMFFEAAIADCPCAVFDQSMLLLEGKKPTYTQFIHFQYLKSGEVFKVVSTIDACIEWLNHLTVGVDEYIDARRNFTETFVRPNGIGKSAARCAADQILNITYENQKI